MMSNLHLQIQLIYPDIPLDSYMIRDSGEDVYIAEWRHQTLVKPTQAQLDAVASQAEEQEASEDLAESSRKIWPTVADFYAEFTSTEKYAIQSSNVPAIVVARGDLAMWRGDVWSDNAGVLAGLDAMVKAKILTAARRAEILAK